jgi:CheY-like chemotaxis protein
MGLQRGEANGSAGMDLSALRILVLDDNRNAIEIVRSVLGSLGGRRITAAYTADDAFRLLGEDPYDFMILDQHLGVGDDGVQFVKRIRNDPQSPNPFLPILMLTGHADLRLVRVARDAGVSEFLAKPFTAAGLLRRVEVLIMQPRPFVRSGTYFGPDRRRRADPDYRGPERRQKR